MASMQDQPDVGMEFIFGRDDLLESLFDGKRGFADRKRNPVRDAKNMRIHRDGGLTEGNIQHHISSFTANARKTLQGFAVMRHLAAVILDQVCA